MDLAASYRLAPAAAIRPERFGGLIYRYDNRRLYFLHSHDLVAFVGQLDGSAALGVQLDQFLANRALAPGLRPQFLQALTQLERLGIIDRSLLGTT